MKHAIFNAKCVKALVVIIPAFRAKNMSSMAFSMYLFTRGEGPLKNTQDLFTQAQYFAEEGVKLFQCAQDFSAQVNATFKPSMTRTLTIPQFSAQEKGD